MYFPSWFEIKSKNKLTKAAPNFYNIIDRVRKFPNKEVRKIALKVLQRNGFSIHPENVLLAMLADESDQVRRKAVDKILSLCGVIDQFKVNETVDGSWEGVSIDETSQSSDDDSEDGQEVSKAVRVLKSAQYN